MPECLAIDIGNTRCKYGIFRDSELLEQKAGDKPDLQIIHSFLEKYTITHVVLSAVRDFDERTFTGLGLPLYRLDSSLKASEVHGSWTILAPAPFKIDYEKGSPGNDRVAACAGARSLYADKDLLVVTSGTCITYNLLQDMTFKGGAISPGLNMRFQALNHFTGKLPLLAVGYNEKLLGRSTEEAIRSGVQLGITQEIDGMIRLYEESYPGIKIVMSGGDSSFLQKRLKSGIFAQNDLELYGLNYIFNKHVH